MKTVWLLISPVVLFVNSAVTNSGAAYVMSLSLHSSSEAFTSSKRGSEKERDIDPEKSSIGEISVRMSSRPPIGFSSPASIRRWNHASSPTSHSKDWVCRSSRSGTRSGSRIFANETRVGAPGRFRWSEVVARVLVACGDAKMRPSGTALSSGGRRGTRDTVFPTRSGREVRSGRATHEAWPVHAVCCQGTAISPPPSAFRGISTLRPVRARAELDEGSAKSQSSCKRSGCRDGSPSTPSRPKSDLTDASSQGPTRR